jgi:hypothetical protein
MSTTAIRTEWGPNPRSLWGKETPYSDGNPGLWVPGLWLDLHVGDEAPVRVRVISGAQVRRGKPGVRVFEIVLRPDDFTDAQLKTGIFPFENRDELLLHEWGVLPDPVTGLWQLHRYVTRCTRQSSRKV